MSDHCQPAKRDSARRVARQLRSDTRIKDVAVIPSHEDSSGRWTLEVITVDHDGVPTTILEEVCEQTRSVRSVAPQGEFRQIVAYL